MDTLEISFYGPFFFDLRGRSSVEIYAPRCDGHKAGIFYAKDEAPLLSRQREGKDKQYVFGGAVFPTAAGSGTIFNPSFVLNAKDLATSTVPNPSLDSAGFHLTVPVPRLIYGINFAEVEVVKGGSPPTGTLSKKATALRFYYDADLSKTFTLSYGGKAIKDWDFESSALGVSHADIQIRFAATTPDDIDHVDAEECFNHIAQLAEVDCWLSHEDVRNPGGISANFARAGNDCRAAVMILKP
jgi:hypothetical protein